MEEKVKAPFWQKTWFVVLVCIFVPPAGIALLWVGKKGSMELRIVLTVFLGFYSFLWLGNVFGVGASKTTTPPPTQTAAVAEQTPTEKAAAEKVIADKAAANKIIADKTAADKAEADRILAEKAAAAPGEYKAACEEIPYDELARFPDRNIGKKLVMTGEIIQVSQGKTESQYRLKLHDDYNQIVLIGYSGTFDQGQVLDGDIVSFWGDYIGTYTYTSTMGGEITIPALASKYYSVN